MTQKELLYLEDACGHEESIIKILNDAINSAEDEKIISFLEEKIENHTSLKDEIIELLEDKSNE